MSFAATVLALVAFWCIQPLGALQWRLLLPAPRPPLRRLVRLFALASTANNSINSVVGHAAATALVAREPGVGTGPAVALLVLDQLVVGLVKLFVISLALGMLWERTGSAAGWSLVAPLIMAVGAIALLWLGVRRWTTLPHPLPVSRLPRRVRDALHAVHAALRAPSAPRAVWRALPVGLAMRMAEAVAVVAVQRAAGIDVPLVLLPLFLSATALATLLPVVPANLGTYEGALVGAYQLAGIPTEQALAAAAWQHACQLIAAIVPGLVIGTSGSLRILATRAARIRGSEPPA